MFFKDSNCEINLNTMSAICLDDAEKLENASKGSDYDLFDIIDDEIMMFDDERGFSFRICNALNIDLDNDDMGAKLEQLDRSCKANGDEALGVCFKFKATASSGGSAILVALSNTIGTIDVDEAVFVPISNISNNVVEIGNLYQRYNVGNNYSGKKYANTVDPLEKYVEYYSEQIHNLEQKQKNDFIAIDIDLLRDTTVRRAFSEVVVDDKDIILPISGKFVKYRTFKIEFTKSGSNEISCQMLNCFIRKIPSDEFKDYENTFKETYGIKLPTGTSLVQISCEEIQQKNSVIKNLFDAETEKCKISLDIVGEITRLKRVKYAFESIQKGNVDNSYIARIISKGENIQDKNRYIKDKVYCKQIEARNPILKGNEEQITAIDKIMQMEENDTHIFLVQGPPGTGKTELITALCNEFAVRKKTVLFSSNVQVACNNISERAKNNKEVILKRYENIGNDEYDNEVVFNKKKYVVNQTFNKYKVGDKTILSKEELDETKRALNELKSEKDSLCAEKSRLEEALKGIRELSALETEKNNEIEKAKSEQANYESEMGETKTKLEALQKKKAEMKELVRICDEIRRLENERNKIKDTLENRESQEKEHISRIAECKASVEKCKAFTEEEFVPEIVNFLANQHSSVPAECQLVNPEITKVLWAFRSLKQIICPPNACRVARKTGLPTKYACELLKKKIDELYFESPQDKESFETYIRYKIDTPTHAKMAINVFNIEIGGITKKKLKEANIDVKTVCYDIINNLDRCAVNIVEKYLSKKHIDILISKAEAERNEAEQNYLSFLERIKLGGQRIKEINGTIAAYHKTLTRKEGKTIGSLSDLSEKIDRLNKEEREIESQVADQKNKIEGIKRSIPLKEEKLEEIRRQIEQEKRLRSDEIAQYEKFKILYDPKVKEYDREIKKLEESIKFIEQCIETVGEEIVYDYLKELKEIEDADDDKPKALLKYFDGYIDSFDSAFRLDGDNWKGSTISMTTSQIAKLFRQDNHVSFDYAVIDEASKCSLEDLVVILPRVKKLVLIGDYMQLEPIFDDVSKLTGLEQYLFENDEIAWQVLNRSVFSRLLSHLIEARENNGSSCQGFEQSNCVAVMKKQFRMNKGIFDIVSPIYSIHNGFEIVDMKNTMSRDVLCFDIDGKEESMSKDSDPSYFNEEEVDFIQETLKLIQHNKDKLDSVKSIGIITGYSDQVRKLKAKGFKKSDFGDIRIEIGTFDRFQGREYDLVLVSMVRTEKLGFLKEVRRMNVAMSRAKKHLIILGNFKKIKEVAKRYVIKSDIPESAQKEEKFVCNRLVPLLAGLCEEYPSREEKLKEIQTAILGANL